ncbi:MAG: hypothetical protein ACRDSR_18740 [Pseudonocardiaceae bacterium]
MAVLGVVITVWVPKTTEFVVFGTQTVIMGVVEAGDAGDGCS